MGFQRRLCSIYVHMYASLSSIKEGRLAVKLAPAKWQQVDQSRRPEQQLKVKRYLVKRHVSHVVAVVPYLAVTHSRVRIKATPPAVGNAISSRSLLVITTMEAATSLEEVWGRSPRRLPRSRDKAHDPCFVACRSDLCLMT